MYRKGLALLDNMESYETEMKIMSKSSVTRGKLDCVS